MLMAFIVPPRVVGRRAFSFVPSHSNEVDAKTLKDFSSLVQKGDLLVLTGAGISTESGIPDYRNFLGWSRWSATVPNKAHSTIYQWEKLGLLTGIVTQNVDQLHYKAGSSNVVELHGTNSSVICTSCSYNQTRFAFQQKLAELNQNFTWITHQKQTIRPDGDIEVPKEEVKSFIVPNCPRCNIGILKPNVVFFGDSVPSPRVRRVRQLVEKSKSVIVIGSSLFVFSGYRIILQAKELGKHVAIVNIGPTRADDLADFRSFARAGNFLPKINT